MVVTQKMIAEFVGVSQPVVADALNGRPKVSDSMRLKIRSAAEELGYHRHANNHARAMVARRFGSRTKTGIIAVLYLPNDRSLSSEPFFVPMLEGLEQECSRHDAHIALCSVREENREKLLKPGQFDGVVSVSISEEYLHRFQQAGVPVVSLSYLHEGIPGVRPDDELGIRQATEYLIAQGHRRIAYLGFVPDSSVAQGRLDGFRETMAEHGLAVREKEVEAVVQFQTISAGGDAVESLLRRDATWRREKRPQWTALVCYNDLLAMGAVRRLEDLGLHVPDDISVTGFDDLAMQYGFRPALTSVHFDRIELGRRAMQLLQEQITDETSGEPGSEAARQDRFPHVVLPTEIAVRDSTRAL